MGKIKSALELALERTESIAVDRSGVARYEAKQKGKKLANEFLEGKVKSLEEEIKKAPKDEKESLTRGIFDIMISQITLPTVKEDLARIEAAAQGLNTLIGGKAFGEMAGQLIQILNRFLDESAQFEEAVKKQYAPKLRQKEEELSRRTGQHIKLDPFQDPEFVSFFSQNIHALRDNYEAVVTQVREEAARLFEGS